MYAVNCLFWISKSFQSIYRFSLSFFVYFFLRLCLWLEDIKILSYSALDGSHKNWSPKANMQISLKFITGLHMIIYHFMVKIRTCFQLHKYKYNVKFCRWTVFKSVGELSSKTLSVNCLVSELSRFLIQGLGGAVFSHVWSALMGGLFSSGAVLNCT